MAVTLLSKTALNYDSPDSPRETSNGVTSIATIELRNVKEEYNEYNCNEGEIDYSMEVKSYRRRFYMLMLYFVLATLGSMLYPQHIAEANVTGCYYGVSQIAVNWTSQITMLTYIVLIIPVSLLMNILDLRWTLICGSILNTTSVSLQFLALKPDGFPFVMLSCFFDALASVFIIGMSPFLAARWFPANEISRACAFGVLGNEIGVSFGLMFTPLLVSTDCSNPQEIESGKRNVAYVLTILNAVLLIILYFSKYNYQFFKYSNELSFLHIKILRLQA
ncbi:uncharacterized MFS-type transporter C09D4.1 [Parasteatoda tepidariorum]|uniref:uncharacterized MFS-type transporter C09D4.1 n=1 Tax=Parasteatoda tepidariorum TaxID=114398 RepID=UPI001C720CC0|nr:uncharacterized MFS-type transporter C09D4.1 [Parasteatoda tepidariorum]